MHFSRKSSQGKDGNNDKPYLHHAKISIKNKGFLKSKSYVFSICSQEMLKAESLSMLQFGSFQVYSKEYDTMNTTSNIKYNNNKIYKMNKINTIYDGISSKWNKVGLLNSPGFLWDRSVVIDSNVKIFFVLFFIYFLQIYFCFIFVSIIQKQRLCMIVQVELES